MDVSYQFLVLIGHPGSRNQGEVTADEEVKETRETIKTIKKNFGLNLQDHWKPVSAPVWKICVTA